MKLIETFRTQVKDIGELRYAWFTSFNLNIEFVETYLLPIVLDMDIPKNRLDYEHYQVVLSEKKLDFRVFCDKRFLQFDMNKRTSIPVHGVTPSLINFSSDSLFHPKVIYLEGLNGRRVLGVGSANLTLGGWGRNQEVFRFFDVTSRDNYQSICSFFKAVFESVGETFPLKRWHPSQGSGSGDWSFVHSLQGPSFLHQLFDGEDASELMVWSPFLAADVPKFINEIRDHVGVSGLKVNLVSDLIDGLFIRTSFSTELQEMLKCKDVVFYENPSKPDDRTELMHSKIWKLGNRLAIGSWNFTAQGSNLNLDEENANVNVEAGAIFKNKQLWHEWVGPPLSTQDRFASADLLALEGLNVPPLPPFDLRVSFDWREQRYDFCGSWIDGDIATDLTLKVPGHPKRIRLEWRPRNRDLKIPEIVIRDVSELLREHRFEVFRKGEVIWRGLITENFTEYRRPQAFDSLDNLLDAFVFGKEPGPGDAVPFRIPIKESSEAMDVDPLDPSVPAVPEHSQGISYFRLFKAANEFAQLLANVRTTTELNRQVFRRPGCLLELVEKTQARLASKETPVFNWFLAQEVSALCRLGFKMRLEIGVGGDDDVPKSRWNLLELDLPKLPRSVPRKYVSLIHKECGYARAK